MALGSALTRLEGYRFEVRYSDGAGQRARAAADITADAYAYFTRLYQYRWQRLAAKVFDADGEDGLIRLWGCFHATDRSGAGEVTARSLAPLLTSEVSETLGRAVRTWR
jgi:hypothetical protein